MLSPPDVGGLRVFLLSHNSGLWTLAAGSLTAIACMSADACLTKLFLVALPWGAMVLCLRVGRQVMVVVLDSGPCGRRGEGGAEAQAVAQGSPVLLTLQPDAPYQCLLHLFTTAQENIHEFYIWTKQREGDTSVGECSYYSNSL